MTKKTAPAPKVTLDEVLAAIKTTTYTLLPNGRTTVCQITCDNGFSVEGLSACVNIENYDQEIAEHLSYERAVNELWGHLGFRLADRQHQAKLRKSRGARYRDSKSGTYVTAAFAKLNPATTEKEQ